MIFCNKKKKKSVTPLVMLHKSHFEKHWFTPTFSSLISMHSICNQWVITTDLNWENITLLILNNNGQIISHDGTVLKIKNRENCCILSFQRDGGPAIIELRFCVTAICSSFFCCCCFDLWNDASNTFPYRLHQWFDQFNQWGLNYKNDGSNWDLQHYF